MKLHEAMNDELFEVERKIARRADALSRQFGSDPLRALDHWRMAEAEVWESLALDVNQTNGEQNEKARVTMHELL